MFSAGGSRARRDGEDDEVYHGRLGLDESTPFSDTRLFLAKLSNAVRLWTVSCRGDNDKDGLPWCAATAAHSPTILLYTMPRFFCFFATGGRAEEGEEGWLRVTSTRV